MTTTFPPFFTGMMIVLISHFLVKHYLLYLPHELSHDLRELPHKKKRVRFRLPNEEYHHEEYRHEEYPSGNHSHLGSTGDKIRSIPNTFETVDVKGELLKFVKDYGKDDYSVTNDTSSPHIIEDNDELKEFFEIGSDSLNVLDITRDIETTTASSVSPSGVNGFDSFEMADNFALYGTNSA